MQRARGYCMYCTRSPLVVGRENPEIRKIKLSGNSDLEEYTNRTRDQGDDDHQPLPINFFALLGTEQSFSLYSFSRYSPSSPWDPHCTSLSLSPL